MNKMVSNQKGFTLVELLVVMVIASLIVGVISSIAVKLIVVSGENSDSATAFQQVQNAGLWVKRDTVMAQNVTLDDPQTAVNEFITLYWTSWNGNSTRVAYTLENATGELRELKRYYFTLNGTDWCLQWSTFVAESVVLANTSSNWDGKILTMQIAARVGNEYATRTYQAMPRPLS
jgi:prepilin-type N-terminal cleavage/methylation domain-containing protein